MDSLIAAKRWYDTVAVPYKQGEKGEGKQLFVKLFGKGAKQPIAFIREGTPDMIWEDVQFLINSQSPAYSAFEIHVCSALQDDKALKYTVMLYPGTGNQQQNPQMAGIGNLPGMYGAYSSADIGAIEKRLEEKYDQKLKEALEKKDLEDRVAGLEDMLKRKKLKSGDWTDKLETVAATTNLDLSNPQSIVAIGGIIMGAIDKIMAPFVNRAPAAIPGVAGTPQRARNGAKVYRYETDESVPNDELTENENGMPENDNLQELNDQEELAIAALDILTECGVENPGQTLVDVAVFFRDKRAMAEGLINMAKSMQNQG